MSNETISVSARAVSDRADALRHAGVLREEWAVPQDTDNRALGRIEVRDPATGTRIGSVPSFAPAQVEAFVDRAQEGFAAWSALAPAVRRGLIRAWFDLVIAHRDQLAYLVTLEQGKPIAEARDEVAYGASFIRWYGEDASTIWEEMSRSHLPGARTVLRRVPVGVVLAITPWNFPCAMVARKAAAALAAGCSVIVRPADETPFSAVALVELAERAGIPAAALSVVTGTPENVVDPMLADPRVAALSFTGSTPVGRRLLAASARTVKRMVMELGGNAPFIVFEDVDVDAAVEAAVRAKFVTSGQDCLAANRILVQRRIYHAFVERFAALARALRVGHGLSEGTQIGPLIHLPAAVRCDELVRDACANGARLVTGGRRHQAGQTYYEPTVLCDVVPAMRIAREEIFGPLAAIMPFDDADEALEIANDTEYGLIAYVFAADTQKARGIARALQFGMVAINRVMVTGPPIPFGGMKQSGLGREGSRHGLEAFTEIQYLCEAA
jgi:aspartate-semialdehyde dehydrogenase